MQMWLVFFICFFPQDDQTRAIWVLYKHLHYFLNIGLCPTRNKRLLVKGGWRHGSKYFRLRLSSRRSQKYELLSYYIPSMMNCSCCHILSYKLHYQCQSLIGPQQLSERSRDNLKRTEGTLTTWPLLDKVRGDSAVSQARLWYVELVVVSSASSLCFFLSANLQRQTKTVP